jgi:hypothetical protein
MLRWLLGDPLLATGAVGGSAVPSYEELHAEVQSILVPPSLPAGASCRALAR